MVCVSQLVCVCIFSSGVFSTNKMEIDGMVDSMDPKERRWFNRVQRIEKLDPDR